VLELPLSEEVKGQDIPILMSNLCIHEGSTVTLWEWMTKNWAALKQKLPPGLSMLGDVVSTSASGFSHCDHAKKIEKLFNEQSTKGFDQYLARSLEAIRAKDARIKRDSDDVKNWLKTNGHLE
jgi:aminopeptidase 2